MTLSPDWERIAREKGLLVGTVRVDAGHPTRLMGKAKVVSGKRAFVMLPVPPSVNALYANVAGKGRVKTKAYREWADSAVAGLYGLSLPPPPWSIRYTICAGEGWPESRDIGNAEKPLTDLLVSAGLLTDDCTRYVRKVSVEYDPESKPNDVAKVRIEVRSWSAGS